MRIQIVAENYPPASGGVATSAQRIAENLVALGNSVTVYTFDGSRPLEGPDYCVDVLVQRDFAVYRFGPFFLRHPDSGLLSEKHRAMLRRRVFNAMLSSASTSRPDVVLSLYALNSGYLGQLLANALGVPAVAGIRGNDIGLNIFHVERFGVVQWVVSSASRIVTVNDHLRTRLLTAFPYAESKVTVIPNGVYDRFELAGSKATLPWDSDSLVIAFVGTLREKKGIVWLLKALTMPDMDRRIKLLVIGPDLGNLERRLCGSEWTRLIEEGRCHVTGQIAREEVASWIAAADAIIMPSLDDGMANGVLEGMVMGKCPIVTEVLSDAVGGQHAGCIVPYGDTTSLRSALDRLLNDRGRLALLGERAREHVLEHHRPEAEAARYIEVLMASIER